MAEYLPGAYDSVGSSDTSTYGGGLFKGDRGTTGSSAEDIFRSNESELNTDVTILFGNNASAAGPLVVAVGATLDIQGTCIIL